MLGPKTNPEKGITWKKEYKSKELRAFLRDDKLAPPVHLNS